MMHTQNSALIVLPNLVHSNNHWSQAQTQFHIYIYIYILVTLESRVAVSGRIYTNIFDVRLMRGNLMEVVFFFFFDKLWK